mmetsp:Transcript_68827/g.174895  ORF Transcript_68827/g.174895 Transcript_68827/m.174895 type:complete len:213 (-) Transcript_68827:129-767(-)
MGSARTHRRAHPRTEGRGIRGGCRRHGQARFGGDAPEGPRQAAPKRHCGCCSLEDLDARGCEGAALLCGPRRGAALRAVELRGRRWRLPFGHGPTSPSGRPRCAALADVQQQLAAGVGHGHQGVPGVHLVHPGPRHVHVNGALDPADVPPGLRCLAQAPAAAHGRGREAGRPQGGAGRGCASSGCPAAVARLSRARMRVRPMCPAVATERDS